MTASNVTTKLFLGCLLSPPLKAKLDSSLKWKESVILSASLEIALHNKKQYIGLFLKQNYSTLSELKQIETKIQEELSRCLEPADRAKFSSLKFTVFAQVLIS